MTIAFKTLGMLAFPEADALQKAYALARRNDEIGDTVLFLEHPPVYTFGKQSVETDFVKDALWREMQGIDLCRADRGGRMTYHGPGQLIGYLIFKLSGWRRNVPVFVAAIEAALVETLAYFKIAAHPDPDNPGVWVNRDGRLAKIAAIGLHISRGITRHGFALNVFPNLAHYTGIVACGLHDRGVTSMQEILGDPPVLLSEVSEVLKQNLTRRLT